jgi:hypothetical protein
MTEVVIDPTHDWIEADLEALPDDGSRYEIIDGRHEAARRRRTTPATR